jgi:hypothetical protein
MISKVSFIRAIVILIIEVLTYVRNSEGGNICYNSLEMSSISVY